MNLFVNNKAKSSQTRTQLIIHTHGFHTFLDMKIITGYSFWDWLLNSLHKFTWIVFLVHNLNKLGKFWEVYGQLLNIMSRYGWYEKSLRRSHIYQPVIP